VATSARPGRYGPLGYQQITSLSAATALTIPSTDVSAAVIGAETQDVRWRDDGTSPTASVGNLLPAGTSMWFDGDLNRVKFIEATASAKINVNYYTDTRPGQ
jgi:hypothetical protein